MKQRLLGKSKQRKRYLAFEISPKSNINSVSRKIIDKSYELIGKFGVERANIKILKECCNKEIGIIRVNHKYVDDLKLILKNIKIKTIGTSGILKKAKQRYIK